MTARLVHILCDATADTGMGHFLRCASLSLALRSMGCESILIGEFGDHAKNIATYYGVYLQHQRSSIAYRLHALSADTAIVIDSYAVEASMLVAEHRYVLIDDFCRLSHYPVEGVINFTLGAQKYDYLDKGAKAQALGTQYFLEHPDLKRNYRSSTTTVENVLVLIGSGDKFNVSPVVVEALSLLDLPLSVKVVSSRQGNRTDVLRHVGVSYCPPVPDVNRYYAWADFCITSGGLAKYECAFLGKPAAAISLTPLEADETAEFSQNHLCFDLGNHQDIKADRLSSRLMEIVSSRAAREKARASCLAMFPDCPSLNAARFVVTCLGRRR